MNFLMENWQSILEFLSIGGLSSLLTMKIGVKSAKADLISKIQDIYGKMIDDLQEQVKELQSRLDDGICHRRHCENRIK